MERTLAGRLETGARAVGFAVEERVVGALGRYLDLLLFWNQRINLTAIRDPETIIDRHFVDSLAVIPHIPADAGTLADLGSGPGFPGAVIALARPALAVTLVESIHKKAAFLEALRREIPTPNVTVVASRAEEWARRTLAADVVISRATWDILEWLEKGRAWVKPGGTVIGMEGSVQHALPPDATRHPYGDGTRAVIVLRT
jgi:16S rRNA (guanine527-N7)-methyltransferase